MDEVQDHRELCLTCRRAKSVCWCGHVVPQAMPADLVLLQHPRESRNPIGTARMAHLSWAGSKLWAGVEFGDDPRVLWQRAAPGRHVVLFPRPDARDVRELAGQPGPLTVWGLDGTWWQARKLWQRNPWLHELPAYRIHPDAPGQYRIRKEPEAHCLSTVESVAYVMDVLRGERAPALRPFHAMVDTQLGFIQGTRKGRHRKAPRTRQEPRAPWELVALKDRLVFLHAEGNGWPTRVVSGHPAELMQLLAWRRGTSQEVSTFVQVGSRAEGALGWLGVDERELAGAVPPEEAVARWSGFFRTGDVVASWGWFPVTLLVDAGADLPPVLNIQPMVHDLLGKRVPTVEAAAEAMGLSVDHARPGLGRGARRLAALASVVDAMLQM